MGTKDNSPTDKPTEQEASNLQRFEEGETVTLALPAVSNSSETITGTITKVKTDLLGEITGDPRDSFLYKVTLENEDEETISARDSDLNRAE
jgi:hypothetical protein